jgi:hypothetical protein
MSELDMQLEFSGVSIPSTRDGKVSVVDAIYAVTGMDRPQRLWERLVSEHPQVLEHCETHIFKGEEKWVVGSHGWEKIFLLIPEYFDGG